MKDKGESSNSQDVTACSNKTGPVPECVRFQVSVSFRLPVLRSLSDEVSALARRMPWLLPPTHTPPLAQ